MNKDDLAKVQDAIIIGTGIGSLTTACLLARDGLKVLILERNLLPGGCVSSYYRKGFVFEAGATTLVGLDKYMPLRHLLDETGIQIAAKELEIPMRVHLKTGEILTRYRDLDQWIEEVSRVFGAKNQRAFWEYCYQVSQFVWQTSLQQLSFPPTRMRDLLPMLKNFRPRQLQFAKAAFVSMKSLLAKYDLLKNEKFVDFINEQLLITAQNRVEEVNVLFGATALCYTNYGNYYINGGLINLVQPLCDYIKSKGGEILTRTEALHIEQQDGIYQVQAKHRKEQISLQAKRLISGIPINNTLDLIKLTTRRKSLLKSPQLVSAFSMGIGFRPHRELDCIHHQIHLEKPLPQIHSDSIFVSLNHPDDTSRSPEGSAVLSVSTHIFDPAAHEQLDKIAIEAEIIEVLVRHNLIKKENIDYQHSSTPSSWESWTGRKYGFVGGYPQYLHTKPWQMNDARLDGKSAYICGDTTYPGQGIPGACLSGIIAYEKMKLDRVI